MAAALWGKVYYDDLYAGELRQEPGGRCLFAYDPTYLEARHPAIAFTLPPRSEPHVCEQGLHPFFDNLVAEGWPRNAQARALRSIRPTGSPCCSLSDVTVPVRSPSSTRLRSTNR